MCSNWAMIVVAYVLGFFWLCWLVLRRDGTWREAGALFFAPVLPACTLALFLGRLPWIFFIPYAHMTALVFLPIYWVLRREGRVPPAFPVLVGALAGVVTAFARKGWWIPPTEELFKFVTLGLAAGLLFWAIAFLAPGTAVVSGD